MNASEARSIMVSKKKTIAQIYEDIRVMAEAGNNDATYYLRRVLNPDDAKRELEDAGYTVTVSNDFFVIHW